MKLRRDELNKEISEVYWDLQPKEEHHSSSLWTYHTKDQSYGTDYTSKKFTAPLIGYKMPTAYKAALENLSNHVLRDLNSQSLEKARSITYRDFYYGYSGIHYSNGLPRGTENIVDVQLLHKPLRTKEKQASKVRKHIYATQKFMPLRARRVGPLERKKVHLILPLYQKEQEFKRFLDNHLNQFLKAKERIKLTVVCFVPENSEGSYKRFVIERLQSLKSRDQTFGYSLIIVHAGFSRGLALEKGIDSCDEDDLVFFVDVDVHLETAALDTIRLLAKKGKSVYFPIVFSHFGGNTSKGYWRQHGYGMAAMYKSDFIGMDLSIHGWGKEDVTLYDKYLTKTNITIFRASDPHIVHMYHHVNCDPNLSKDQLKMCTSSYANNFRSDTDAAIMLRELDFFVNNRENFELVRNL